MPDFKTAIQAHETRVNELHKAVHETFAHRNESQRKHDAWTLAARQFREQHSEIDDMCDACLTNGLQNDPALRQFAFDYLSVDPYYYRSGYFVEKLLRRVRKLRLTQTEKEILQDLILRRIENRALRNFRRICNLIPLIESEGFRSRVSEQARSGNPDVRRRAEFTLGYFP